MKKKVLLLLLLLIFACANLAFSQSAFEDSHGNLRMENAYIAIFVNQDRENLGRFAMDVTGGNPLHQRDNNKPLVYGHPHPWSSYTTIRVDDVDYVFGGPTSTRAGIDGEYGEIIQEPIFIEQNQSIVCAVLTDGIEVTQELSFVENPATSFPDTAKIAYTLTNTTNQPREVGLRIMIDTMLGENDGAPFRVLDQAIDQDRLMAGGAIPEFWQAFDSLQDPRVVAEGGFRGEGLTPPDEVYFSNWGSLADGVWDFNFSPGREFWRVGEFELDSAIAMYWNPIVLEPNQTIRYVTSYGLGGLTIKPGMLYLAVRPISRMAFDGIRESFPIQAHIENTSDFVAREVVAKLDLASEFQTIGDVGPVYRIGDLQPGEGVSVAWDVTATSLNDLPPRTEVIVSVDAQNTDSTEVLLDIEVVTPPALEIDLKGPDQFEIIDGSLTPNPFDITGIVINKGGSTSYNTNLILALPPGLTLSRGDMDIIPLGELRPGEEVEINWRVRSLGVPGRIPFGIEVVSFNAPAVSDLRFLNLPALEKKLSMQIYNDNITPDDIFVVEFKLENVQDFREFLLSLTYDPQALKPIYTSRGNIFVDSNLEPLPFNHPQIDYEAGEIATFAGSLFNKEIQGGTLFRIVFKALESGITELSLKEFSFKNSQGEDIDLNIPLFEISIE